MKTNTTYSLVLKFLLLSFLTKAQSFSIRKADSLFNVSLFIDAATAFERVYFFSSSAEEKTIALFRRAEALKNAGEFQNAYRSLERINKIEVNDSVRCASNYQLALNLYLGGFFLDAEKYCAKNYSLPVTTKDFFNTLMLHGLVLNELNLYTEAVLKFKEHVSATVKSSDKKDSLLTFINHYYHQKNIPKLKSLKKARRLSKVIPGAGLFYAGKPGKAFLNIGFQVLATGYTALNVYATNYITAASVGFFMMKSFYTGGINQLNEVIPLVNYRRSSAFNNQFKKTYIEAISKTN